MQLICAPCAAVDQKLTCETSGGSLSIVPNRGGRISQASVPVYDRFGIEGNPHGNLLGDVTDEGVQTVHCIKSSASACARQFEVSRPVRNTPMIGNIGRRWG